MKMKDTTPHFVASFASGTRDDNSRGSVADVDPDTWLVILNPETKT